LALSKEQNAFATSYAVKSKGGIIKDAAAAATSTTTVTRYTGILMASAEIYFGYMLYYKWS
jgi:hypothetical protein